MEDPLYFLAGDDGQINTVVLAEIHQADNGQWVIRATAEFKAMFRTLRAELGSLDSVVTITGPTLCALLAPEPPRPAV